MSLHDYLARMTFRPAVNGRVRMDGLSDEEVDDLALLDAEDAAIEAAAAPAPSPLDALAEIAARLQPSHRPHKKGRP